jgi:hypothetical protein
MRQWLSWGTLEKKALKIILMYSLAPLQESLSSVFTESGISSERMLGSQKSAYMTLDTLTPLFWLIVGAAYMKFNVYWDTLMLVQLKDMPTYLKRS